MRMVFPSPSHAPINMNHNVDMGLLVPTVLLILVLLAGRGRCCSAVKLAVVHTEQLWCGITRIQGHFVLCYFFLHVCLFLIRPLAYKHKFVHNVGVHVHKVTESSAPPQGLKAFHLGKWEVTSKLNKQVSSNPRLHSVTTVSMASLARYS